MNLSSNVSCVETLASASLKIYLPSSPGIENEAGISSYGRIRYRCPKYPAVQTGGRRRVIRIALGLVVDRYLTPVAQ